MDNYSAQLVEIEEGIKDAQLGLDTLMAEREGIKKRYVVGFIPFILPCRLWEGTRQIILALIYIGISLRGT